MTRKLRTASTRLDRDGAEVARLHWVSVMVNALRELFRTFDGDDCRAHHLNGVRGTAKPIRESVYEETEHE